jgi:hypothetical protein
VVASRYQETPVFCIEYTNYSSEATANKYSQPANLQLSLF